MQCNYCQIVLFCFADKLVDSWQLFLLRAAGFLLPCYIMAWAISMLQRRRQRQVKMHLHFPLHHLPSQLLPFFGLILFCHIITDVHNFLSQTFVRANFLWQLAKQEAAALAATQVAFVLQSGQRRGLQFAIASGRSAAPPPSGPAVNSPEEAV